ncbi:MAG: hypothetical protein STHCBS139747_007501, partial [Sporothrix thermara]
MALGYWPDWKEYENGEDNTNDASFSKAKAEIVAQYGESALRQSWLKVCANLEAVTKEIAALGTDSIPVFQFDEVRDGFTSPEQIENLKRRGCCVVRGVLTEEETGSLFRDLKDFVGKNPGRIDGWPAESKAIFNLYNSPTQIAIRTHPNHLRVQKLLNTLYHDETNETSPEPLSYTDAVRIRSPGLSFFGLGPHIDAGSLCRWADPQYRSVYDAIFSGQPETFDAYDLGVRHKADQFLFKAKAHSAVFRSFQGWTALTPAAPGEGSLLLFPDVRNVIAYVVLRPFFAPPTNEEDIMDASKWTFSPDTGNFPGTFKEQSQRLSISSHPHLRLRECMTFIPNMGPGDTVWWHTD